MKPHSYLPVWVENLPIPAIFNVDGSVKLSIRHYVQCGVVKIVAGAEACHVRIDVKRPYFRPEKLLPAPCIEIETVAAQ